MDVFTVHRMNGWETLAHFKQHEEYGFVTIRTTEFLVSGKLQILAYYHLLFQGPDKTALEVC